MRNKNSDMSEGDTFKLQQTVALRPIVVNTEEEILPSLGQKLKDAAWGLHPPWG